MLQKDFIAIAVITATGAASREWRNAMVRKVIIALAAITFTGAMAMSSTADARMGGGGGGGFRGGGLPTLKMVPLPPT